MPCLLEVRACWQTYGHFCSPCSGGCSRRDTCDSRTRLMVGFLDSGGVFKPKSRGTLCPTAWLWAQRTYALGRQGIISPVFTVFSRHLQLQTSTKDPVATLSLNNEARDSSLLEPCCAPPARILYSSLCARKMHCENGEQSMTRRGSIGLGAGCR